MKHKSTYHPEDIEALLLHKKFDQLLPDEKKFVLQHLSGKEEYVHMQNTLWNIKKDADNQQLIAPKPQTKEKLMAFMEQQSRKKFPWFTWNSIAYFLFPADKIFYRQPAFQFACMAGILFFSTWWGINLMREKPAQLAQNTHVSAPQKKTDYQEEKRTNTEALPSTQDKKKDEFNHDSREPLPLNVDADEVTAKKITQELIPHPDSYQDKAEQQPEFDKVREKAPAMSRNGQNTFAEDAESNNYPIAPQAEAEMEELVNTRPLTSRQGGTSSTSLSAQANVINLLEMSL